MHDDPLAAQTWMIGIDSWVIQDGNYPDFVTGQRAEFALEFASRSGLRRLDGPQEVSVRWVADSRYEVTAQIVHDKPNAQVRVDPSFYVDDLAREDGFPPLSYAWTVQEVLRWASAAPDDLASVEKTDAWADKSPGYVLRCRLEPAPRSATPKSR
ncbi:MAG: hypothetical protein Q7J48_02515 [Nocardioides sp.]|nr:hypothetical protein [Nocardioides sp.]